MARPRISRNERANKIAWEKMTVCQRECGKTSQQLTEIQRTLREQFYARSAS